MRYAWTFRDEYFGGNRVKAALAAPLLAALRRWDRATASRVDRFVAISRHVQDRIQRFYGRAADIVYPPVDTARHTPAEHPSADFDLVVSALVPYKRVDLAVKAYNKSGFPLRVIGIGGEADRLRAMAGPNITFLGWQPDDTVLDHYRNCRLLVFPGEEDFGIVPLEAQACGRPVAAYACGGALETVRDGLSGVLFPSQTVPSLLSAVEACARIPWDSRAIRAHAETFSAERFAAAFMERVDAFLDADGVDPRR
jgi:hypothetical protein